MLFDDVVGALVAALAMALACLTIIFAQSVRCAAALMLVQAFLDPVSVLDSHALA